MPLTRRVALPLVAFAVGLAALCAAAVVYLVPQAGPAAPSIIGGPFTLTNQDGKTVTERDFAGRTHLVFFGFTHCPDVCPTTLQQVSDVLAALGPRAEGMKVAFVTVDPERDTPAVLKEYLSSFDPRIVGLTGTPEQTAAALKAYRGYSRKVESKAAQGDQRGQDDYVMEHTAIVYVMDAKNRFLGALNLARPPEDTARELGKRL